MPDADASRRALVKYLAASPLLAALATAGCDTDDDNAAEQALERLGTLGEPDQDLGELISSADDALDVFDMRVTAQRTLPPAHYGYIATGVDGDATLRANRTGFDGWQLRSRRLVDISDIDMRVSISGTEQDSPIVVMPTGSQRAFHAEGELATARAAKAEGHLMMLSTVSTTSVEDVAKERGAPIWYQLYPTNQWEITERLLRRAEGAGCPVVLLTVDLPVSSNRISLSRFIKRDRRNCAQCHASSDSYGSMNTQFARKPMFDGIEMKDEYFNTPMHTWEFVERLKAATPMTVYVKGIVTAEDAAECLRRGADGIVVSNHGGRADESGRGTIESLPEIARVVRKRVPVILDSGVRRGTDVFKALAMGADAVGIGRPYLWGLGAFGEAGVTAVLRLLKRELRTVMALAGTRRIADIGSDAIVRVG
ncbi:MAG: alpha-hydroxy-acid oxidizing protein [Gemmatimonadaceae bacterium]|nr:alpha-hydroxy-acid oxidizing protein [Gemmatimonadaceae bacterium]